MSAPTREEILEEMRKIGAISPLWSYPSPEQIHQEMQKIGAVPMTACGGYCAGGDQFQVQKPDASCKNWIIFTGQTSGKVFEYESKKTGYYQMDFEMNETFKVSFRSTCSDFDKDGHAIVTDKGRYLRLEDHKDMDYSDLIIKCWEGRFSGEWKADGSKDSLVYKTGGASCPPGCECVGGRCATPSEPPPPPPPPDPCEGVECPPCHVCQNGQCIDQCPGQYCFNDVCADCLTDDHCPPHQICQDGHCVDRCSGNTVWNGEECICDNGFIDKDGVCQPECPSKPPTGGSDDCDDPDNQPCFGVFCMPPRVCSGGRCQCPDGLYEVNGMCMPEDPCTAPGMVCPPNSHCVGGGGVAECECDPGYVKDANGYCVMAETPDCPTPDNDCCFSDAPIQLQAGTGLGGGGSFRLDQPCDKTITIWLDKNSRGDGTDECEEDSPSRVCDCGGEITKLMDLIVELKAELDTIKSKGEQCKTKNDC